MTQALSLHLEREISGGSGSSRSPVTIRKRVKAAGFLTPVGCHTWGVTGITIYLAQSPLGCENIR